MANMLEEKKIPTRITNRYKSVTNNWKRHQWWDMPCMYSHAKANDKYTKDYNPSVESWYLMYWDVNNLYGLAMSERFPKDGLEKKSTSTSKFIHLKDTSLRLMLVIPSVYKK